MKTILKTISLMLAVLFLVTSLAACGGDTPDGTTEGGAATTPTNTAAGDIPDTVPTDLNYKNDPNNTITFLFVTAWRSSNMRSALRN